MSGNDRSSWSALGSGLHTVSGIITSLAKRYFTEVVLVVQPLEQMILYQHDKVNCPCSCTSLSKADCDGLKLLYADGTMSALHGVCSLKHSNSPKQKIQFFGSAERFQSNLEEQMDLREGRYQGDGAHCRM